MNNNDYYDIDIRIRIKIDNIVTYGSGISELLQKIDDGLDKIKTNGKFTEIYQKWFGKEPPEELL